MVLELVSNSLSRISQTFWSADVWLPPNVTWDDIQPTEAIAYPNFAHVWYPILFSFGLTLIRVLLERYHPHYKHIVFLHLTNLSDI